jgi:hypothetical protein
VKIEEKPSPLKKVEAVERTAEPEPSPIAQREETPTQPKPAPSKKRVQPQPPRVSVEEPPAPVELPSRFAEIAAIARERRLRGGEAEVKTDPVVELLPAVELDTDTAIRLDSDPESLHSAPVQLSWKPVSKVRDYEVTVYRPEGGILEKRKVSDPQMVLRLESLRDNRYEFQVVANLENGQVLKSRRGAVQIAVAPPRLKEPEDGRQVQAGAKLVLTWSRTTLTERYELQISRDSGFREIQETQRVRDNVSTITVGPPGTYFWRVRGEVQGRQGDWSGTWIFESR